MDEKNQNPSSKKPDAKPEKELIAEPKTTASDNQDHANEEKPEENKNENPSEKEEPKTTDEKKNSKKKKTVWYILGGCSGCFVLILIAFLILYFVIGGTIRKAIDEAVKGEEKAEDTMQQFNEQLKKAQEEADKIKQEAELAQKEAEKNAKEAAGEVMAEGQVGITDNIGNFTSKSTFNADVDNISVEVTPKNAKSTDKITVELYDPAGKIMDKETKTVGSSKTLNFVFVMEEELTSGKHEYKVLSGDDKLDSGTFMVEAAVNQPQQDNQPTNPSGQPPSLDPATFWYKDYFKWSDEWIKDWKTMDIDGDGYDEGCILGQHGNKEEYHVYILDWNEASSAYTVAFDKTYQYKTTRILLKDWNGDNQNDFVLVHTENSGDATAIVYKNGQYVMEQSGF